MYTMCGVVAPSGRPKLDSNTHSRNSVYKYNVCVYVFCNNLIKFTLVKFNLI